MVLPPLADIEAELERRGIRSTSLWPRRYRHSARCALRFILEDCRTWDEVAGEVRKIPRRAYIVRFVREWWRCYVSGQTLCIEKCRRMLISWVARCLELYVMGLKRSDVLLGGEHYDASAKHCWRYSHLYRTLQKDRKSWNLPEPNEMRYKGERKLQSFGLSNGSICSILNGEPNSIQGDGVRIVALEEFGIYSAPADVLAQARIVTQGEAGKKGFVSLITNAATDADWQRIKRGGLDASHPKPVLSSLMRGLEQCTLATGVRYLKLHYYADPDKGEAWLNEVQNEMRDTPRTFNLQILMDDSSAPGALWTDSDIDPYRVKASEVPDLRYIGIALDPATKNKPGNDENGIIVAGSTKINGEVHAYVFMDLSGQHDPGKTARIAVNLEQRLQANELLYEDNQGGDWIKFGLDTMYTLNNMPVHAPLISVTAKRGKMLRAEPIAALYKQGLIHHVMGAKLEILEEQMKRYDPLENQDSPDRLDALVIVLTRIFMSAGHWAGNEPQGMVYNAPGRR